MRGVPPIFCTPSVHVHAQRNACTKWALARAVNEGTFREDLYYRLAVIEVSLPALRARREDIPLLAARFFERSAPGASLPRAYLAQLEGKPWPGNVRELRNAIERDVTLGLTGNAADATAVQPSLPRGIEAIVPLHMPLKDARAAWSRAFESVYVRAMLEKTGGNLTRAAQAAGVSRRFLQRMLVRLGMRSRADADGDDE
jgi:DNA-binding NtrC family response regulator